MTILTEPDRLARTCAEIMWKDDQAAQQLGIALKEVGPGRAVLGMTIAARMVNGHGSCHGGYIFALADTAFAYACNAYGNRAVASHCAITYLAPGKLGDDLIALAEERSRGERSGIYDVRIIRRDGTLIAEFRGHSRVIGSFFPAAESRSN